MVAMLRDGAITFSDLLGKLDTGFGEGLVGLMSKRFVCRFAVRQDGLAYSGVWRARRPQGKPCCELFSA